MTPETRRLQLSLVIIREPRRKIDWEMAFNNCSKVSESLKGLQRLHFTLKLDAGKLYLAYEVQVPTEVSYTVSYH